MLNKHLVKTIILFIVILLVGIFMLQFLKEEIDEKHKTQENKEIIAN